MASMEYEKEPCGRCGGSGRYSFNQIDGSRCYGCGGSGLRLTKRGRAAKAFADAMLDVPVQDVGDRKARYVDRFAGRKYTFTGVEQEGEYFYPLFNGKRSEKGFGLGRGIKVRLIPTAEQIEEIAAYQNSLTKAGKPRKGA